MIEKSASAGAIIKNRGVMRKCVRNNYKGATVRAPHSKNPRNPTSVYIYVGIYVKCWETHVEKITNIYLVATFYNISEIKILVLKFYFQ